MNKDMVNVDDVISILDTIQHEMRSDSSAPLIIDKIRRSVYKLQTRKKLTIINGGKNE